LKIQPEFNCYFGLEKDRRLPVIIKSGFEYQPISYLAIRTGYNFKPQLYTAGFSLYYMNLSFSYGFSYHQQLEFSNICGISYVF